MSRPPVPIRPAWAALAAGVAALLLYSISLANGFAYDDAAIIGADPRVHDLALGAILTGGYWLDEGHGLYRPLTTLSFALDWALAPDRAAWFHMVNAVLHAAATALVALLITRLWTPVAGLAGALLFALHPVHVEAVANVVGRAELLAAVFFLGACLVWLRRVGSDGANRNGAHDGDVRVTDVAGSSLISRAADAGPRGPAAATALRRVAVPVLFGAAVFSKESAIMLPAVLPLLDVAAGTLRRSRLRSYVASHGLAYAALLAVALGYVVARGAVLGEAGGPERLDPSLEVLDGAGERVLTALQAWPVYVRLLFAPVTLLADYGPRIMGPVQAADADVVLGAFVLLATLAGGLAALALGRRRTALALLWFPILILPVSNLLLPIGVLVAERTLYLPSVALSFGAAALVARTAPAGAAARRAAVAVAAVVLVLFAGRSLARIPEWDSTDRIMLALVRDRPDAFRGQWHLARMARARGDDEAALARYVRALELWPHRRKLVMEVIGFASRAHRLDYAAALSADAVRRWPRDPDAHRYLAATTLDRGDTTAARRYLVEGLRVAPTDPAMVRMRDAIGTGSTPGSGPR